MKQEIPRAVKQLARLNGNEYQLILWLDQEPFIELFARDKKRFGEKLKEWIKKEAPALERSIYRTYIVGKDRIIESDLSTKNLKTIL